MTTTPDLNTPSNADLDDSYLPGRRAAILRWSLGVVGVAAIGYAIMRILQTPRDGKPLHLFEWLLATLILHDGILAPAVTVFGFIMARLIPGRARAYLQGGLIAGALVASFTVVEIYRHGKSQPGNALLEQNYTAHLVIVAAIIAALTVVCYLTRVLRDRRDRRDVPSR